MRDILHLQDLPLALCARQDHFQPQDRVAVLCVRQLLDRIVLLRRPPRVESFAQLVTLVQGGALIK